MTSLLIHCDSFVWFVSFVVENLFSVLIVQFFHGLQCHHDLIEQPQRIAVQESRCHAP